MAFLYQVKKTPCYDVNGYEFYPVRNYDMNSDDWMWVPEEFESVFQEKGPFVQPLISPEGIMTGYAYLVKPQVSQESLIGVVQEIVQQGYISTDTKGNGYVSKFLKILNPEPATEEVTEEEIPESEIVKETL